MVRLNTVLDGKYKILALIGEGGMSRVYLAMDNRLNKQWAIKEIKKKGTDKQNRITIDNLINEANLMKDLDHPALPRIVDIIDDGKTLYVVMDYIEGESLNKILREYGAQPQKTVIEWGKQLCEVLDYLHTRNPPIVYRDMKPANIMLCPNGTIKLIDFGTAREFKRTNVQTTTALGTRGYAAPEQFGGSGQTDARTDIYSLGVTLYQLVTGRSPAEPPYEIKPIRKINPNLSSGLEKIIDKCTKQDPNARYQSCAELLYDLEHYEQADDVFIAKKRKNIKSFSRFLVAGVVLAVVAAICFGVRSNSINSAFDTKMSLAKQQEQTNTAQAEKYYLEAADIRPESVEPYLGLITCYEMDNQFTVEEKNQLDGSYNANKAVFMHNTDYPTLAYQMGKMYWYYYTYGGSSLNQDGSLSDNDMTRIKASKPYFEDAAKSNGFADHNKAQTYYDIAQFNSAITNKVTTEDDSGTYAPYWNNLKDLQRMMQTGDNGEKISLESYALILNSIETYAHRFADAGISKSEMQNLYKDTASALAKQSVTTDENASLKAKLQAREANVQSAIVLAYAG